MREESGKWGDGDLAFVTLEEVSHCETMIAFYWNPKLLQTGFLSNDDFRRCLITSLREQANLLESREFDAHLAEFNQRSERKPS